jgi:hypothetical protein
VAEGDAIRHGNPHRYWEPPGALREPHDTARMLPEVGRLIVCIATREPWRVIGIDEIHQANWAEETTKVWEQEGRPEWEAWAGREVGLRVEPPYNPSPSGKDRRGLRLSPWWNRPQWLYLSDPFPACVRCGLLWPCPCDDQNKSTDQAMGEFERLAAILPGCCWACGNPVVGRQHRIEFDGENLLMPGAQPALFHTSGSSKTATYGKSCRSRAVEYERLWLQADPRRQARLTCPGTLYWHFGYHECTTGDLCPGESANHEQYVHCVTLSQTLVAGAVVTFEPLTNCGNRGCRGPKVGQPASGMPADQDGAGCG